MRLRWFCSLALSPGQHFWQHDNSVCKTVQTQPPISCGLMRPCTKQGVRALSLIGRERCAGPHVVEGNDPQSHPRSGGLRHRQRCCSPPSMLESSLAASCCPKDLTGCRPLGRPSRSASSTRSDVFMNASIPCMPSLQDKACCVAFAGTSSCGSSTPSQGLSHRVGPVAAASALPAQINVCTSRVLQVLIAGVQQCQTGSGQPLAPARVTRTATRAKHDRIAHRFFKFLRDAVSVSAELPVNAATSNSCKKRQSRWVREAPARKHSSGSQVSSTETAQLCMKSKACAFAPQCRH